MMMDMGYDTVRLAFSFWDGDTHNKLVYTDMDQIIDFFYSNGISVILDLHNWQDMSGMFGSQEWIDNWVAVSTRYKDDHRVVAYEIFNEPPNGNPQGLKACLDAIRANGDNKLVIYPDPRFWAGVNAEQVGDPEGLRQYGDDNTVIAFHEWYSEWADTNRGMDTWFNTRKTVVDAWDEHWRVWNGEVNYWCGSGTGNLYPTWLDRIIRYYINIDSGFNLWMHGSPEGRSTAWDTDNDIIGEILGGEAMSWTYKNSDNEEAVYQFVKTSIREVRVQPGETVILTCDPDETMERIE
jgi:hypothetical protein